MQIVHGFGEEAGDALVRHPDVPVITFTGSRETGVLVTKNAADELKHVHLELGGKNAIIVMDDADLDLAVDGIVWSRVRHGRPALHRRVARDRAARRLRGAAEEARRARGEAAHRRAVGGRHRDRPGDQRDGGREDPLLHRDRPGRGREAAHRRRARRGPGLLLPADGLRRRRPADADRAGGDLRPDDRAHPRRLVRGGGRAPRTASSTACRRRSSRAT